ncbi:MAG: C-GCAxxG-C-C family protein [Candidatus Heimdallarchaeaceae archaeon]
MSNIINNASKYWNQESNCAQAVACGVLENYNQNDCLETVHNSMLGFGGGMGERSICGAVTGGLAVLGILLSKKVLDKDDKSAVFRKFKDIFNNKFKTLNCGEILAEFILPDGSIDKENPERRLTCTGAVELAASIVKEVLDEI